MKNTAIIHCIVAGAMTIASGLTASAQLVTSDLVLHVTAENRTVKGSGVVASLVDQSTTGEDLVTFGANASDGATVQVDNLNGFDTIQFGGTSDGLEIEAASATHLNPGANGLTLFAVMSTDYGDSGYLINKGNNTGSTETGYSIITDTNSSGRIYTRVADDASDRQGESLNTTTSDFFVYGFVIDPAAAPPDTDTLLSFFNGPDTMGSFFDDGALNAINSAEDFRVAVSSAADGMELAELAVYGRALTEEEYNQTGYFLGEKYAIDTTFVPEPSSALLLLMGAGVLALRRRR